MRYHEELFYMGNEELIEEARKYALTVGSNWDAELLERLADALESATSMEPYGKGIHV